MLTVIFIFICAYNSVKLKGLFFAGIVIRNSLFFLFTLFVLVVYMSIKNKDFLNPFSNYFGFGDVLFYISVTPLFLLNNYVFFFIGSMIFSIFLHTIFKRRMKHDSIPLAGFSAIFLALVLLVDQFADFYKLTVTTL